MSEDDKLFTIPEEDYIEPTSWAAHTKKTHYTLDGLAVTEDGKVTKAKLFEFLKSDIHDYSNITLSAEEAHYVARQLRHLATGLNAVVPIICGGPERCPFQQTCPLIAINKAPVARQCLVEKQLITVWTQQYIDEFNVEPDNRSQLSLVMELAELDIYDRRATILLSKQEGQTLLVDEVVGVNNEGTELTAQRVHQALEVKERVKRRKLQILEALVGTPKERYKREAALKKRDSKDDPSTAMADLREKLDKLSSLS